MLPARVCESRGSPSARGTGEPQRGGHEPRRAPALRGQEPCPDPGPGGLAPPEQHKQQARWRTRTCPLRCCVTMAMGATETTKNTRRLRRAHGASSARAPAQPPPGLRALSPGSAPGTRPRGATHICRVIPRSAPHAF